MLGFTVPVPEKFEEVKAIQHFTGTDSARHDLRFYTAWYTQKTAEYLMHCFPGASDSPIRVVFQDSQSNENFFNSQFTHFNMLRIAVNRPGLFISKEPGAGQNHFLFGILFQKKLLIINPVGETQHKDIYTALKRIQKECQFEIYLSETIIQRDTESGLVSCGPICVELAHHFHQQDLSHVFTEITQQSQDKSKQGLSYKAVDVREHLPISLKSVLNTKKNGEYVSAVWNIRLSHLFTLIEISRYLKKPKKINQYFEEECINAPEQQLLNLMSMNNQGILELENTPAFIALQKAKLSRFQKIIKKGMLGVPEGDHEQKSTIIESEKDRNDKAWDQIRMIRNIFLISLLLIPLAHFFLWPLLVPYLSVAAAQFLTATSTPFIFIALSMTFFGSLILGIDFYEQWKLNSAEVQEENATPSSAALDQSQSADKALDPSVTLRFSSAATTPSSDDSATPPTLASSASKRNPRSQSLRA